MLYIIFPNGRIGSIDTIIGEKEEIFSLESLNQKNLKHVNYDIDFHIHNSLISFIEDNDTLHTFDFKKRNFLLINEKIFSLKSHSFTNNALIVLDNNNVLYAYNIKNKKIFWKNELSKILSKKDTIVNTFISKDLLVVIFSEGLILEINKFNGQTTFKQNLKLDKILSMTSINNNFAFSLNNGKIFFYKQ